MLVLPACRVAVFSFWVFLVLAANNCSGEKDTVEVVGGAECADCVQHNIKTSQAFKGLRVTIDCKSEDGKLKTRGGSELDQEGKFRANLPSYDQISEDGGEFKLKEDCFARLHSASGAPCAIQNNKKDSKFVLKSKANGQQVLGLNGNLKFSPITCPSAFMWLYFPPLPKFPTYFPPPTGPTPTPPQPLPPSRPAAYNNPTPTPQPQPQPPSPQPRQPPPPQPLPPPPLYNNPPPPQPQPFPPPPLYNDPPPSPAPAPVYNNLPPAQPKASPPPVPVNNDPAPMPSPVSIEPIPPASPSPDYGQFLPPPFPHKSFPQIPKAPPIPQLPLTPTTPRKFFNKPHPPSPSRA